MERDETNLLVAAILSAGVLAQGEKFDIGVIQDQVKDLMGCFYAKGSNWALGILKDWALEIGVPEGASLRETFPEKMAELLNKYEMLQGENTALMSENSKLEEELSRYRASNV